MDGKIWHLRVDIGSGTVMDTDGGPDSRYLGIYATFGFEGLGTVYLSPTREQWFHPGEAASAGAAR